MKKYLISLQIAGLCLLSYGIASLLTKYLSGEPLQITALWILISAIIVLQDSFERTVDAFFLRLLGSGIGAILSVSAYTIFGSGILAVVSAVSSHY